MARVDPRAKLAELARRETRDGAAVVTVYLDTRWIDEQQRERVRIFLKNELRRAREAGRARPDDLDWIDREGRAIVEQSAWQEASGVALFASGSAGLREVVPVRIPFENAFVVNDRPYLPPLAAVVEEVPPLLVVFIDGASARFIPLTAAGPGDELVIESPVEGRHSMGGWAAWAQSRYQRHIEEHRGQHFGAVADAIVGWSDREGAERIVLAGESRMVALLREHLPERVTAKIAGVVSGARYEPGAALARRAADLLARVDQSQDGIAVNTVLTEAAKGGQAVDGLERTLEAVNRGAVRHVYVWRALRDVGRECDACKALQRGLAGGCSYCGRDTRTIDLQEAIVDRVIATGGSVSLIDTHAWLERRGGVAAVLRYAA
jgi:hypothetical protein